MANKSMVIDMFTITTQQKNKTQKVSLWTIFHLIFCVEWQVSDKRYISIMH